MKLSKTGIAILALFIIGAILFTKILTQHEEKWKIQDFRNKGIYLISLISLYPVKDYGDDRRDFFLKTLTEYTSREGFLYFFVHHESGQTLVSLAPQDLAFKIPEDVTTKSLYTMGLTIQTFHPVGSADTIYEFAKPIFEGGNKAGTVRLGLKLPAALLFSWERISLLAMIAFFVVAALTLGYYGITHALKPLKTLNQDFQGSFKEISPVLKSTGKEGQIGSIIESLGQTLTNVAAQLNQIKSDKVELSSKLGVTTFEKNQIINILDSINFGILITDIQDHISHINEYMLNLLNKQRTEVIDRPLGEILQGEEVSSFISQQQAIEQARSVSYLETALPELAPGEIFKVSLSYLKDAHKVPIGKMISLKKITSEKLAEKAKHEFITRVAHELLTPLTNIKSYSEMLMDGEVKEIEMQKEFYNTINQETNRLTRLIRNLLDVSKIEMGGLVINKGLVRTDWLIDDCITTIESYAKDKNIAISKILPDIFPSLIADKELLKAAIINILGNGIKYTPKNGKITVSISEQDKMVIFDITDNGYGMAPEDLSRIYDKFFRSADPRISEQQGSGLGLAITSEIIHLHDGEIEVQSELNEGTHFTIRIPKEEYYIG